MISENKLFALLFIPLSLFIFSLFERGICKATALAQAFMACMLFTEPDHGLLPSESYFNKINILRASNAPALHHLLSTYSTHAQDSHMPVVSRIKDDTCPCNIFGRMPGVA